MRLDNSFPCLPSAISIVRKYSKEFCVSMLWLFRKAPLEGTWCIKTDIRITRVRWLKVQPWEIPKFGLQWRGFTRVCNKETPVSHNRTHHRNETLRQTKARKENYQHAHCQMRSSSPKLTIWSVRTGPHRHFGWLWKEKELQERKKRHFGCLWKGKEPLIKG